MTEHDERIEWLQKLLPQAWSRESSSKWTAENPACGQCGVTALVAQDLLGGELRKTPLPDGWHFYNCINGRCVDFTESQFAEPVVYADIPATWTEAFADTNDQQYAALRRRVLWLWNEPEQAGDKKT